MALFNTKKGHTTMVSLRQYLRVAGAALVLPVLSVALAGCSTVARAYDQRQARPSNPRDLTADPPASLWAVEYRWGEPAPGYEHVSPTELESWQHVRFENRGQETVYNLVAGLMGVPASVTVLDGTVTVGELAAGGSAWSEDAFTLRMDTKQSQDPCEGVVWRIEYDDAAGTHHVIEGVPQFPPGEGPCD